MKIRDPRILAFLGMWRSFVPLVWVQGPSPLRFVLILPLSASVYMFFSCVHRRALWHYRERRLRMNYWISGSVRLWAEASTPFRKLGSCFRSAVASSGPHYEAGAFSRNLFHPFTHREKSAKSSLPLCGGGGFAVDLTSSHPTSGFIPS